MSIVEYMKRKKVPVNEMDEKKPCETLSKRELLASAAEKRISSQVDPEEIDSEISQSSSGELDGSQDLFPSSPRNSADGTDIDYLTSEIPLKFNRSPVCLKLLPTLEPKPNHTVLFRPHILSVACPRPYPDTYRDSWDKYHVRMPCSPENLYPTLEKKVQKRWELIEGTLLQPFQTSKDLEAAILTYNHHYRDKWNFEAWHSYCNVELNDKERDNLFSSLLPDMVNLALQLPSIVTQAPYLLKAGTQHSLTLSQKQVACLLANAFFCTYPRRNSLKNSEFSNYPDINFSRLFRGVKDVVNVVKTEKLKTILHYFERVIADMPKGTVTYTRQLLEPRHTPKWQKSDTELKNLYVTSEGTIEDNGEGFLQVDFANRMVGGGVVGEGCVQEEIRFLMCPELILSRLFTEKLEPNESLLVTGAERFSSYSGYAQTFRWTGDYMDFTPRDRWGRRCTEIIAIDAHVFHCYSDQFRGSSLKRELDKAYCGFRSTTVDTPENLQAVATGNWGCGAFGGSIHLKALLQLMAAALAKRDMVYFTFGDKNFTQDLRIMHDFLIQRNVTVGKLWSGLSMYGKEFKSQDSHISLYPYLEKMFLDNTGESEVDTSNIDEEFLEMRGVPGEIPEDMSPLSPDYAADTP